MIQPKLTIAIPTIEKRKEYFNNLLLEFRHQSEPYGEDIEIIWESDNGEMSIGNKRNILYQKSNGLYTVQWDDDDWICQNGIDKIMNAIETNADVITYNNYTDIEQWGKHRNFHKYISIKNNPPIIDYDNNQIFSSPDQKSVIKTEIARQVKFYDMNHSEDWFFMRDILPFLKTEFLINEFIYLYLNKTGQSMNPYERYKIEKSSKLI